MYVLRSLCLPLCRATALVNLFTPLFTPLCTPLLNGSLSIPLCSHSVYPSVHSVALLCWSLCLPLCSLCLPLCSLCVHPSGHTSVHSVFTPLVTLLFTLVTPLSTNGIGCSLCSPLSRPTEFCKALFTLNRGVNRELTLFVHCIHPSVHCRR